MTTLSVENYEQILQNNPGHPVFVRLANLYIEQGNCEKAVEVCLAGLMASPPAQVAIVAHIIEAKALLLLGRTDEALAHLENSTELSPDDPQAYKLAGALLLERKMHKEALPFLSNALARHPTDEALGRRMQECLKAIEEAKTAQAAPPPQESPISSPSFDSKHTGMATQEETSDPKDASPFDQLDLSQIDSGVLDGDVLPTVVNQAAYVPNTSSQSDGQIQAATSEKAPSTLANATLPIEPDPDSAELPEFSELEAFSSAELNVAEGEEVISKTEVTAISEDVAFVAPTKMEPSDTKTETSTSTEFQDISLDNGDSKVARAASPAEATPEASTEEKTALSPFDQVLANAPSEFDDIIVPTVVDQDAYVPGGGMPSTNTHSSADGNGAGGDKGTGPFDAFGVAGGFDEDLRDLSDIFRILDGEDGDPSAPKSNNSSSEVPAVPEPPIMASSPEDALSDWENGISSETEATDNIEKAAESDVAPQEADPDEESDLQIEEVFEAPSVAGATQKIPEETAGEPPFQELGIKKEGASENHPEMPPVLFDQVRRPTIPPPLTPHLSKDKLKAVEAPKGLVKVPPALPSSASDGQKNTAQGLLSDLPDEAIFSTPPRPAAPSVAVASQAAGEIARQYERELREKLLQQPPPSFWHRHWMKFSVVLAALILLGAGFLFYRNINLANQGERIQTWRQQTLQALTLATPQAYRDAIELSDRLLGENPQDSVAQAHKAYAAAALLHHFDESEASEKYRQMAEAGQDVARAATPGLALAIDLWLAAEAGDKGGRAEAVKALHEKNTDDIPNGFERAEVLLLQAELAMAKNRTDLASQKLNQAMNAAQDHVETFVTSGNWFMRPGDNIDPTKARTMYDRARQHSPENVEALVGLVESSLNQRGIAADDDKTLMTLIQKARTLFDASQSTPPSWNAALDPRITLATGRLYGRLNRLPSAVETLEAGLNKFRGDKTMRRRFLFELGNVHAKAGAYDAAAVHFQDLVKDLAQDKGRNRNFDLDLLARKSSAKALLALGNPQGAFKVASDVTGMGSDRAKKANRELAILRGIALYEMHQFERAKLQLRSTAFDDGNHPTLAVIYMALIDGMTGDEGDLDRAINLMNNIKESHRLWPLAKSVQGRLLLKKNDDKRARLALTSAIQRDPLDWESPCLLGQFEAELGNLSEARAALEMAYSRNPFHDEAALWLAEVDMLLGDFEASEKILRALIERKETASAQEALVYLAIAKGDLNGARFELTQLRKAHPRGDEAAKASILFFAMNDDTSELASELKRAKKRFSVVNKLHLARRFVRMDRTQEAASIYSALTKGSKALSAQVGLLEIDLKSSDSKKKAAALKNLDVQLKAASEKDSPIENEARARLLAADALRLIDAKKKQPARQQAKAAVKANFFSPEAHLALAKANLSSGKSDSAVKELELAIRLDPAMADAYATLGLLLEKTKKDSVRAQFCLEMALRLIPNNSGAKPELQKALARLLDEAGSAKGQ